MNEQERNNLFSDLIARHQSELYGYIFAVVRNWEDADDLYQSVCLVLWSKFELFRPGSSFFAWARQTAKITISNHLRHKQRLNCIGEKLLDTLTEVTIKAQDDEAEPYLAALRQCKAKLSAADGELLELHYIANLGSCQIAHQLQRPQQSICRSLNRIRGWLLECIEMELARQEHSERIRS
jgi:RNA polymerase sigma-70 factor (ECF subfamily)